MREIKCVISNLHIIYCLSVAKLSQGMEIDEKSDRSNRASTHMWFMHLKKLCVGRAAPIIIRGGQAAGKQSTSNVLLE